MHSAKVGIQIIPAQRWTENRPNWKGAIERERVFIGCWASKQRVHEQPSPHGAKMKLSDWLTSVRECPNTKYQLKAIKNARSKH